MLTAPSSRTQPGGVSWVRGPQFREKISKHGTGVECTIRTVTQIVLDNSRHIAGSKVQSNVRSCSVMLGRASYDPRILPVQSELEKSLSAVEIINTSQLGLFSIGRHV